MDSGQSSSRFFFPPAPHSRQGSTGYGYSCHRRHPPTDSTTPVDLSNVLGKPEALEVDFEDAEKNKVWGILAYVIFFIPLITAKDSPFAKYHANQGLALFLTMILSLTVLTILSLIPFIGFIFWILHVLVYLGFLVLVVLGIINAAGGKCVPLPIIGGIKLLK